MRLGFDEVYVVVNNDCSLMSETLYDIHTARKVKDEFIASGELLVDVCTLETAIKIGAFE